MSETVSPFFICLISFLVGVFFRSCIDWGKIFFLFVFGCVLIYLFFHFFLNRLKKLNEKLGQLFSLIFIILFCFGIGVFRYEFSEWNKTDKILDSVIGDKVIVTGILSDEPQEKSGGVGYVIDIDEVSVGKQSKKVKGRAIFTVSPYPQFSYGDKVSVKGSLILPEVVDTGDGPIFNYPAYLAVGGIYYKIDRPNVALISHHQGSVIKESLFLIKKFFLKKIESILPQPHAALLEGLLLGAKRSLGKDLETDFRRAGIIHIVVLSGYNITIIAEAMMTILSFLPRTIAIGSGCIGIVLFSIMTGGTATIIRSSVMSILVLLAKLIRRDYEINRALLFAAAMMVFWNPKILVFDPSFQLSFLSTVGLIHVSPFVKRKLSFVTEKWKMRETLVSTLSTQLFVLPFLLFQMGEFSTVALVVNILVLSFIPATMLFGFMAIVLSLFHVVIAVPFSSICYLLLQYELSVVGFFSHLSFATIKIHNFTLSRMTIWYAFYGAFFLFVYRRRKKKAASIDAASLVAR